MYIYMLLLLLLLLQALIFSSWLSNEHERPGVKREEEWEEGFNFPSFFSLLLTISFFWQLTSLHILKKRGCVYGWVCATWNEEEDFIRCRRWLELRKRKQKRKGKFFVQNISHISFSCMLAQDSAQVSYWFWSLFSPSFLFVALSAFFLQIFVSQSLVVSTEWCGAITGKWGVHQKSGSDTKKPEFLRRSGFCWRTIKWGVRIGGRKCSPKKRLA